MKTIILAAFAALSLSAAIVPAAFAGSAVNDSGHSGPYDNTKTASGAPSLAAATAATAEF